METTPSQATGTDAPAHPTTDVGRSPAVVEIVGRDDELAALRRFLGRPQDLPGALVVQGEPGSGKTTVFEAGVRLALGAGLRILAARPAEAQRDLSFTGLRDMLDQSFRELAAGLPAPQLRALGVALLREELPPGVRLEVGAVAVGLVTALRGLARSGPVLLAVDDAQWLDPASTAAVRFALRRLEGSPLTLFLLVERTGRTGRPPALLERTLPEERVVRLPLGPLSVRALSVVLRDRLGLSLTRPALRRLHATSGGNPFFALDRASPRRSTAATSAGRRCSSWTGARGRS